MDERSRDLAKAILKRAWEEGREGRVWMIQERLRAARDIPEDHKKILLEITLFGKALPKSPWRSSSLH